jgi:hypothetical protein
VKPGKEQVVTVRTDSGRPVDLSVSFPYGPGITATTRADTSGTASFSFTQPANSISRSSRKARVKVGMSGQSLDATYTIGYGKIDISTTRISPNRAQTVTVWVHTRAHMAVSGQIRLPGAKANKFTARSGGKGWAHYPYHLTRSLASGQTVSIKGSVKLNGQVYRAALAAVVG